jgi:nucleotide-binding universal stress UspA family protein
MLKARTILVEDSKMYRNILVAIDTSERSEIVFYNALALAKKTGANLMLLHVLSDEEEGYPQFPTYSYYPMLDRPVAEAYHRKLEAYEKAGLEMLQSRTAEANKQGVRTEFEQASGEPGDVICELAKSWEADLIIVGSRGLRGLKEALLGSVSNYVTHHAPCSVLIVRTPLPETDTSNSGQEALSMSS